MDRCFTVTSEALQVGRDWAGLGTAFASRAGRSQLVWVVAVSLITALTFTLLTPILYSHWWGLAVYFWYAIPSNTFIHLPHEPAAIYAGTIYDPWLVAVVGGLATVFASGVDYLAIKKVFAVERFASVRKSGSYRIAVRWFNWKPWPTIVFFAFTPIPFDPVRVLAPASNYHFWKYVTANVAGRVFVYYLLATGGAWLPVSPVYLLLIGTAIAFMPFLGLAWTRRKPLTSSWKRNVRFLQSAMSYGRCALSNSALSRCSSEGKP